MGDLVIVIGYRSMLDVEARVFRPWVVHVDAANRIIDVGVDPVEAIAPDVCRLPLAVSGER